MLLRPNCLMASPSFESARRIVNELWDWVLIPRLLAFTAALPAFLLLPFATALPNFIRTSQRKCPNSGRRSYRTARHKLSQYFTPYWVPLFWQLRPQMSSTVA